MKNIKYWILALILAPFSVQALTVNMWMDPQSSGPLSIGENVTIDIWANWDVPVTGGVFDLEFDDGVLNPISSTVVIPVDFENMAKNGMPATGGVLSPIGFSTFSSYAANVNTHIATVVFETVGGSGASASPLALVLTKADGYFFWEEAVTQYKYIDAPPQNFTQGGSVAVVPLPAAAWFMVSGLGFLAFRRKRAA